MSINFSGSLLGRSAEMNVTPMIDILLVLIIIFITVVPRSNRGLTADIPQPSPPGVIVESPDAIVIELRDTGAGNRPLLMINQHELAWRDLDIRLRSIYASRVERLAFIKGDPEVDFQYVAEAIDISRGVGIDHIGLMGKDQAQKAR
ncbi:MAG TPA: biopolymer transporter ExbD [Alphaproteobacteria bacterium]|nr:biopolymer transporter ExbD [Alphaproteobacteria bacterium]